MEDEENQALSLTLSSGFAPEWTYSQMPGGAGGGGGVSPGDPPFAGKRGCWSYSYNASPQRTTQWTQGSKDWRTERTVWPCHCMPTAYTLIHAVSCKMTWSKQAERNELKQRKFYLSQVRETKSPFWMWKWTRNYDFTSQLQLLGTVSSTA